MGGTSTHVSQYDGTWEHVSESTKAGKTIQAPQVTISFEFLVDLTWPAFFNDNIPFSDSWTSIR
jgi:hypothetical protein